MKVLKWIAVLAILVPALLIAGIFVRNKAVGPVGWAHDNTVTRLKALMKDPDSLVIRSSYVVEMPEGDGSTIGVCGIVDGKNSFGGFTGGSRFVSSSSRTPNTFDTNVVVMEDISQTETAHSVGMLSGFESVYWNAYCVDPSHPALVAPKRKPY